MTHVFTEVEFLELERQDEIRRKAEETAAEKARREELEKKVNAIAVQVDDAVDLELEIEALEKTYLELKKEELAAKKRKIEQAIEDAGIKTVSGKKGSATRVSGSSKAVDLKALYAEFKISSADVEKYTTVKDKKPYVKLTSRIPNPYLPK